MQRHVLHRDTPLIEASDNVHQRLRTIRSRKPDASPVVIENRRFSRHTGQRLYGIFPNFLSDVEFDHRTTHLILELISCALCDQLPVIDHADTVCQLVGFIEVLSGQQNGGSAGDQILDQVPEVDPALRIYTGGRLVEKQDLGFANQRGGEIEATAHTTRVGANRTIGRIGEVDSVQDFVGSLPRFMSGEVVEASHHLNVFTPRQVFIDGGVLAGQPDVCAGRRGIGRHINAGNFGIAGVGTQQCGQNTNQRGLSGTVRPEQPVDDACLELEAHAVERYNLRLWKRLDDVLDSDNWIGHAVTPQKFMRSEETKRSVRLGRPEWPRAKASTTCGRRCSGRTLPRREISPSPAQFTPLPSRPMVHPLLPDSVKVLPDTDVEGEWARFAPFEAMHHLHDICNPMTHESLESLLDRLAPTDAERMIDIACGHGEFLLKAAERAQIEGVGLDLSPWVLTRAIERTNGRKLRGSVEWWLGEGASLDKKQQWDIATCLGASWIWHGFTGTLRALATRTRPGGRIAIGDLRTKVGIDRAALEAVIGPNTSMTSESNQIEAIREVGLEPIHCYVSPDEAWARYHRLVIESADTYDGPEPAVDAKTMAREWQQEFERDHRVLEWTVWVAKKPGPPAG